MEFNQGQSDDSKKRRLIVILTVALVLLCVAGVAAYLLLRTKTSPVIAIPGGVEIPSSGGVAPGTSASPSSTGSGSNGIDVGGLLPKKEILSKLWDRNVGGYMVSSVGSSTKVRLFDIGQGVFAEVDAASGAKRALESKAILGIHDAYMLAGDKALLRKLDDSGTIRTLLVSLVSSDGEMPYTLSEPTMLASGVKEIGVSPDHTKAVLVIDDGKKGLIDLYDAIAGSITEVASISITEWIPQVTNQGKIILVSKTSESATTGAYELKNGKLLPIIHSRPAQTALYDSARDATFVSYRDAGRFVAGIEKSGFFSDLEEVPMATIAEKCTFSDKDLFCGVPSMIPTGFPDAWYQGQYDLHDALYRYDATSDNRVLVASPWELRKENLDMTNVSATGDAFFFVNRPTGALYRAYTTAMSDSPDETSSNE